MANQIFDGKTNYVERFTARQSKRIKFPTFKYLDAKLHPMYKDHVVVLSSNEFPSRIRMTYAFEGPPFYDINTLDEIPETAEYFKQAMAEVEERSEIINFESADPDPEAYINQNPIPRSNSFMADSANGLLSEGKDEDRVHHIESQNSEYEGGESDSEEEQKDDQRDTQTNKVKLGSSKSRKSK